MIRCFSKYSEEAGFNEKQFKGDVKSFVFNDESCYLKNKMMMNSWYRWHYTGIWIDNKIVATGLNVAIALGTGGVGTAGIRMLVIKTGTKVAITVIEKAVKNKLLWFGLKQVPGITPVINTIVKKH